MTITATQASEIFNALTRTIESRKNAAPESSYTATLLEGGIDRILKKVGEEATEVILAAKNSDSHADDDRTHLVAECADLIFHLMVMLASQGLTLDDVAIALGQRQGLSGLEEKATRGEK